AEGESEGVDRIVGPRGRGVRNERRKQSESEYGTDRTATQEGQAHVIPSSGTARRRRPAALSRERLIAAIPTGGQEGGCGRRRPPPAATTGTGVKVTTPASAAAP